MSDRIQPHPDPLDQLRGLGLPEPDNARMQADIARARALYVQAGLTKVPAKSARAWGWLRLGLPLGGLATGVVAAFLFLPPQTGREVVVSEPVAARDAALAAAPGLKSAPATFSDEQPQPTLPPAVQPSITMPQRAEAAPDMPLAPPAPAAPPAAPAPSGESTAELASSARTTRLPPVGARARGIMTEETALADSGLTGGDAVFSGSTSFTISGDLDGLWLERENGRLALPLDETEPGMVLQMTEIFMLPARGGLPEFLVIMGQQGEREDWQVFRVTDTAVMFDQGLTGLVRGAITPGEVEAILTRLPAPN